MNDKKNAGGASGAIYKWLGIDQDEAFADDIVASVKQPGDAKHYCYQNPKSIAGNNDNDNDNDDNDNDDNDNDNDDNDNDNNNNHKTYT